MKVVVCKCKQCKASKKKSKTSVKKFLKRLTNKKRRTMKQGEIFVLCYA